MRFFFLITVILFANNSWLYAQPPVAFPQLVLKTPAGVLYQQTRELHYVPVVKKDSIFLQNRLPLNYYTQHLGAACKMELQLEKQTHLPIRIRLGSKEQVDYLEGKFSRNR